MSSREKNPFHPGVGTLPPFLAGRKPQIDRFTKLIGGFPEKRTNLRLTGLRGVGKTVLLKKFNEVALEENWVVVRRDLSPRTNSEDEMAIFMSEILAEAANDLSKFVQAKQAVADTLAAIREIRLEVGDDVAVTVGGGSTFEATALENKIFHALQKVGALAAKSGRGFVLMLDEAHVVADRPRKKQWPLYALITAFVRAQDQENPPLPVMLVLCGLPPLISHLHDARSNSERFFKAENIGDLELDPGDTGEPSEAAQALITPTKNRTIKFDPEAAQTIASEVNGYPYFIQYFGEALWDAAEDSGVDLIDEGIYRSVKSSLQKNLDAEFHTPRYKDARAADQQTLRVAASIGGEKFKVADLNATLVQRTGNANAQSLNRLVADNIIYRDQKGVYAYTAPMFGDFVRRQYPVMESDLLEE